MSTPEFQIQKATPEQENRDKATAEYWRKVGDEEPVKAVTRVEEAAKQLIALTGALQGLYLAVYAFSDLRKQIISLSTPVLGFLLWLVFFIPVVLWLISCFFATRVFVPRRHEDVNLEDASEEAWKKLKNSFETRANEKLKWLQRSHLALLFSFVALVLVLTTFIFLPAAPGPGPTQIIIVTPTPVVAPTPTP
jgi:hypothetical protein